jgi:RNA polymerase sigma-70 factor (ECF subfamily)
MSASDPDLNDILTLWPLVRQAHPAGGEAAREARQELLARYGGAVRRYLLAALRDVDAAEELFQVFACRLLQGKLAGADRARGRFRDFVKGVLSHLIADHHCERRRRPHSLAEEPPCSAAAAGSLAEADRELGEAWRAALLARAWAGLAALERGGGNPWYTTLRLRARHPELRSPELAERLGAVLGRPVTAAGARQMLHRAREKFAELLLYEVRQSLEGPTAERLEEELRELGLYRYCYPDPGRGPRDG